MSRTAVLVALLAALGIASLVTAGYLLYQGSEEPAPAAGSTTTPTVFQSAKLSGTLPPTATSRPLRTATETPSLKSVSVHDGQESLTLYTEAETVGSALAEAGITIGEKDTVNPVTEMMLTDGLVIKVDRAIPLTIQVDGQSLAIFSGARALADVLANAGIALGEMDIITPTLTSELHAGDVVQIVRVREESIVYDEAVPYQTLYQPSEELDLDTKAVISHGVPGIRRRSTRIRYEDGLEVSRIDEGQWIEREPVNEVIGYGTRITTKAIDTPEGPRDYWRVVRMRVTAYTAASSGKSPDHPTYGITASGLPAGTGIVAVDPTVIPFRSEVFVPGYGIGFAGDTGGGVKGRWIDLGYDEDELQTWNGYTDVYYLTPIPDEINYLIPEILP